MPPAMGLDGMPLLTKLPESPAALAVAIDPASPADLIQWARNFGITTDALLIAINEAGNKARDLAVHLQIVPNTNRR